jgi:hypothetical protein
MPPAGAAVRPPLFRRGEARFRRRSRGVGKCTSFDDYVTADPRRSGLACARPRGKLSATGARAPRRAETRRGPPSPRRRPPGWRAPQLAKHCVGGCLVDYRAHSGALAPVQRGADGRPVARRSARQRRDRRRGPNREAGPAGRCGVPRFLAGKGRTRAARISVHRRALWPARRRGRAPLTGTRRCGVCGAKELGSALRHLTVAPQGRPRRGPRGPHRRRARCSASAMIAANIGRRPRPRGCGSGGMHAVRR